MPASAQAATRLTVEDYMRLPDDGNRHEIIDGAHYVSPSPSMRHQAISGRLFLKLGIFLAAHPQYGRVFYAPADVILSNHDVVVPDLLVVAGDQLAILTDANVQGSPAIVVEIQSPGTRRRDETIKRRLFERSGVREYWLIDPVKNHVRVFRRAADASFPEVVDLSREAQGVLTTPLLPGLLIDVAVVLAD